MSLANTGRSPAERAAHSYVGALYLLPSDDEERQRLLALHQLFTHVLSGRLTFPPISLAEKEEVLDIGTGAGAWLCDLRTHIPESVQIYGIDIESRLFPNYAVLSPNVHLSVCSATNLPSYWSSKFTLVHQRLLVFAYTSDQWRRSISEMYRVLVPGGYAQLIESGPEWVSGPKLAAFMLFLDDFLGSKSMLLRCCIHIPDMLKATGFVDVKSEETVLNLGKWAGREGAQGRTILLDAFRGMRDSVMRAGGLGRFTSAEEFNEAVDEVSEEMDNTEGSHTYLRVTYGRKPL